MAGWLAGWDRLPGWHACHSPVSALSHTIVAVWDWWGAATGRLKAAGKQEEEEQQMKSGTWGGKVLKLHYEAKSEWKWRQDQLIMQPRDVIWQKALFIHRIIGLLFFLKIRNCFDLLQSSSQFSFILQNPYWKWNKTKQKTEKWNKAYYIIHKHLFKQQNQLS